MPFNSFTFSFTFLGMDKSKISTAIKSQVQSKKELPQIRVESKPNIQVSTEIVGEKEVRITIKY